MNARLVHAINRTLTAIIVVISVYIIGTPMVPELQLYARQTFDLPQREEDRFVSRFAPPVNASSNLDDNAQNQAGTGLTPERETNDDVDTVPNIPNQIPGASPQPENLIESVGQQVNSFFGGEDDLSLNNNETELNISEQQREGTYQFPTQNVLVIPSIGVDDLIFVSNDPNVLEKGIWHRPNTSTPDQGGNTVLVAHRFFYNAGQALFYHLPKMTVGEEFVVYWNRKAYVYRVFETAEVEAEEVEIEGPSDEPILTLYTCTPLWTSERRFVVKAILVDTQG